MKVGPVCLPRFLRHMTNPQRPHYPVAHDGHVIEFIVFERALRWMVGKKSMVQQPDRDF